MHFELRMAAKNHRPDHRVRSVIWRSRRIDVSHQIQLMGGFAGFKNVLTPLRAFIGGSAEAFGLVRGKSFTGTPQAIRHSPPSSTLMRMEPSLRVVMTYRLDSLGSR